MKIQTRWFVIALALMAAPLLAGCGQKKGESETPPQASEQAAPEHEATPSAETAEHGEGGLMTEGNDLQNLPEFQRFAVPTLVRFRSARTWQSIASTGL